MRFSSFKREILVVLALAVGLFATGANYYSRNWKAWGTADLYPSIILPPAVMFACGHGFTSPEPRVHPYPIDVFLLQNNERDQFDCSTIPAVTEFRSIYDFQFIHFSMVFVFGVFWRVFGISWAGLWPLYGLIFATTGLAAYGLFRAFSRRSIAVGLALWFAFSPLNILHLPSFRDYSKTFFILFTLMASAHIAFSPIFKEGRNRWLACAVLGAVIGIGFRFRSDVVLCLPFCLVTFLLFIPSKETKPTTKKRFSALAATMFGFLLLAYGATAPWSDTRKFVWGDQLGGNLLHGQVSQQTEDLGLKVPDYSIGRYPSDSQIILLASSYTERVKHEVFNGLDYGADSIKRLFIETLFLFPGDHVTRVGASIISLLKLPLLAPSHPMTQSFLPSHAENGIRFFLRSLRNPFVLLIFGTCLLALVVEARRGWFIILGILYFLSYPAIRFQPRHYFPAEIIPLLAIAMLTGLRPQLRISIRENRTAFIQRLKRVSIHSFGCAAIIYGVVGCLRVYQSIKIRDYFATISKAPQAQVLFSRHGDRFEAASSALPSSLDPYPNFRTDYLTLSFSASKCGGTLLRFHPLYNDGADEALSAELEIRFEPEVVTITSSFPIYRYAGTKFKGIVMKEVPEGCLSEGSIVQNLPPFPFLLQIKTYSPPVRGGPLLYSSFR